MIARIDPIPCSLESVLHQSPEGRKGGVDWLISGKNIPAYQPVSPARLPVPFRINNLLLAVRRRSGASAGTRLLRRDTKHQSYPACVGDGLSSSRRRRGNRADAWAKTV